MGGGWAEGGGRSRVAQATRAARKAPALPSPAPGFPRLRKIVGPHFLGAVAAPHLGFARAGRRGCALPQRQGGLQLAPPPHARFDTPTLQHAHTHAVLGAGAPLTLVSPAPGKHVHAPPRLDAGVPLAFVAGARWIHVHADTLLGRACPLAPVDPAVGVHVAGRRWHPNRAQQPARGAGDWERVWCVECGAEWVGRGESGWAHG